MDGEQHRLVIFSHKQPLLHSWNLESINITVYKHLNKAVKMPFKSTREEKKKGIFGKNK